MQKQPNLHPVNATSDAASEPESEIKLDRPATDLQDATKEYRDVLKKRPASHVRASYRAITLPPWWYPVALVGIGVVEWFINYDVFKDNLGVPAIAAGMTMLVALFVALASHEHGAAAKQGRERFASPDNFEQNPQWWIFGFATFGIIVALSLVTWIRYVSMSAIFARGMEVEVWPYVLQGLGGNVLVWVIGCMVSFWVHDKSYSLQEFAKAEKTAKRKAIKRRKQYNKKYDGQVVENDRLGTEENKAAEIKLCSHSKTLERTILSLAKPLADDESKGDIMMFLKGIKGIKTMDSE